MLFSRSALATVVLGAAAVSTVSAQMTLDLTDKVALGAAAHAATAHITDLYTADPKKTQGAFNPDTSSWFAAAIMWAEVFSNSHYTGDKAQDAVAGGAFAVASYNGEGDFLGGSQRTFNEKILGRWNDDLGWWALAAMEAVDAYGATAVIPNGEKFLDVARLTSSEMWEQYDTTCGGGIYWNRDRASNNYKSTITNVEFIQLGARLAMATGNQTYLQMAEVTYKWLSTSGLLTADNILYDGMNNNACGTLTTNRYAYSAGVLLGAQGYMYQATQMQSYLDDSKAFLTASLAYFAPGGLVTDPLCEAPNVCNKDTAAIGKGLFVRGLAQLYTNTNDAAVKTTIQTTIDTAVTAALKNCNAQWWCSNEWAKTQATLMSAYDQYSTAELLVAAATIHGATAPGAAAAATGLTGAVAAPAGSAAAAPTSANPSAPAAKSSADSFRAGSIVGTFAVALGVLVSA
ncbi:hydrolase 76 protein [Thoreauomyces humboldtii]|nr:hydrolase 76 protein [Thoreauomyces humboldtii]